MAYLERDDEALDALDLAIENGWHSPWITDAYVRRGRMLNRFGNNMRYKLLMDRMRARNEKTLSYVRSVNAEG